MFDLNSLSQQHESGSKNSLLLSAGQLILLLELA